MRNYIEIQKYLEDISVQEIDSAVENKQFIIFNMKYPYSPTMSTLVVDPSIKGVERMRAIFRTIEDAKIFIENSTLEN